MNFCIRWHGSARSIQYVVVAMLVAGCSSPPSTAEVSRASIEGTYSIEEWHLNGQVFKSPQVEGHFLFHDGVLTTILHNRIQDGTTVSTVLLGNYMLDSTRFSYRYTEASNVVESPSGITVSHNLPFDELRTFAVSTDANGVRFRDAGGQHEFLFNRGAATYSENGHVLRVWRRVTAQSRVRKPSHLAAAPNLGQRD